MANNEFDLPDDFDDYDDGAITQVRRAHKAAVKRLKELESELQGYRTESRKRTVADVLTTRGYNPKIADLIPGDITSEAEVVSWLDEKADVFQPMTVAADSEGAQNEQMDNQPPVNIPPGYQQFNDVVNAGQAPMGDESQLLAMIASAKNPDELNKILFGNAGGPPVY
jgi:hypothetical protein